MFNNGYFDEEIEKKRTVFTKYGMVFIAAIKHNDRIFASNNEDLNYFTHYAMIHNGKLWRCKSWGGGFEPKSYTKRGHKFARMVMRLSQDEANAQPVSPSKETQLEVVRLRDALQRLVDLVVSLIDSALPRIGIVYSSAEDYPLALRNALRLLGKGGDEGEG